MVIAAIGVLLSRRWQFIIELIFPVQLAFEVILTYTLYSEQLFDADPMTKERFSR